MVELVPALASGSEQAGLLQYRHVLRDGLPGRADIVLRDETRAQLEQRLTVPVDEFVEDRAPGRVRQGSEQVTHSRNGRQVSACLSIPVNPRRGSTIGHPTDGAGVTTVIAWRSSPKHLTVKDGSP